MAGHAGSREAADEKAVVVVVVDPLVVAGTEDSVGVVVVMSVGTLVVVAPVVAAASVVVDGTVVVGSDDDGATPASRESEPFEASDVSVLVLPEPVLPELALPEPVGVASGAESFTPTVTTSERWLYAPTPTAPAITAKAKQVTNAVRLMGFGEATYQSYRPSRRRTGTNPYPGHRGLHECAPEPVGPVDGHWLQRSAAWAAEWTIARVAGFAELAAETRSFIPRTL